MAEPNLTKSQHIHTTAREVDFVTRFGYNWTHLQEILGVTRLIRKEPGTVLKSKYAVVKLEDGNVGEGEKIPYSQAQVFTKDYLPITVEKYSKAVTIEAINEHGYDDAVNRTDNQFLFELQNNVTDRFYDFARTGTLLRAKTGFQAALADAQGQVRNKWQNMHKGITEIVGFCNILDAYDYLGNAPISVQNAFGLNYIENFLGYSRLFLCSEHEIPKGMIVATPVENMILYYVSPDDSDFAKAGLVYTTDGVTNLIGFHVQGNYGTAVSESFALLGMVLMAEYIDGIAVVSINDTTITPATVAAEAQATTIYEVPVSTMQNDDVVVGNGFIKGTLKHMDVGNAITNVWGAGYFLAVKFSNLYSGATSVKVGLTPSVSSGLVELLGDPDMNGVFKITDPTTQKLTVVTSDGEHSFTQYFDLSKLTLGLD